MSSLSSIFSGLYRPGGYPQPQPVGYSPYGGNPYQQPGGYGQYGGNPYQPAYPPQQPYNPYSGNPYQSQVATQTFAVNSFMNIVNTADKNQDSHLTKAELQQFQVGMLQSSSIRDQYAITNILLNNFDAIANNAQHSTSSYSVPTNGTIEANDIRALAAIDGNNISISKVDVSQLANANTSNWPRAGSGGQYPTGGYGTGSIGSNPLLQQLQQLLSQLFGGAYPVPTPPQSPYPQPVNNPNYGDRWHGPELTLPYQSGIPSRSNLNYGMWHGPELTLPYQTGIPSRSDFSNPYQAIDNSNPY